MIIDSQGMVYILIDLLGKDVIHYHSLASRYHSVAHILNFFKAIK